jgi:hypothetical protein
MLKRRGACEPLIRPSGTFSPGGEDGSRSAEILSPFSPWGEVPSGAR